ncbi:MAG: DUF4292 domain-containing protein [Phycisphaerales bacterium]|nr:DUF4292 domain-containing protein [Phycisphaerales bacterium]
MLKALCIVISLLNWHWEQPPPSAEPPPRGTQEAQTPPPAEDLVAQFIRASGGLAAIHSIQGMEVIGHIRLPGAKSPGTFLWLVADSDRAAFETTFPGLGTAAFGSDGTVGWSLLELPGARTVEALSLQEVESRRQRANWFELAFTLPDRADSMKTMGSSRFHGADTWEIALERSDGRGERLFIDKASNLLAGFTMPMDASEGAPVVTVRFKDYKPVGELVLFHRIEILGGTTRVELEVKRITFDEIAPDDARFKTPASTDADTDA